MVSVGDKVRICNDSKMVKILQKGHGEWNDAMISALGKIGRVQLVYPDNDVRVKVAGTSWTFNPKAVTKVDSGAQVDGSDSDSEEGSSAEPLAALLQLLVASHLGGQIGGSSVQMVKAAAEGDSSKVDKILRKGGVDVDEKHGNHEITALHAASGKGHIEVINVLKRHNVNFEISDKDGDRAIHHAALGGHQNVIKLLHQSGVSMNVKNKKGLTALHIGVHKESVELVRCLLGIGCHPNTQDVVGDTPLHDAILKKEDGIVTALLDNRADMTVTNNKGFNAFHHAALKGNPSTMKIMLAKLPYPGLVEEKKEDGYTAIHLAATNDHVEVAGLLLHQGKANINSRNVELQTPLHLAVRGQSKAMVSLLVKEGCDLNILDKDGDTPLHEILMLLSNANNGGGAAPLLQLLGGSLGAMLAPNKESCTTIAVFLAANGADLSKKNKKGQTPIDLCRDPNLRMTLTNSRGGRGGGRSSTSGSGSKTECKVS